MNSVKNLGESLEFGIILSIVVGGLNALWGIFLLPWGITGIFFAFIDILVAIYIKKIKSIYLYGDYTTCKNNLKYLMILGGIFGFIFLGVYLYLIYIFCEELIIKSHLIRDIKEVPPIYASPKIPQHKK